MNRSTLGAALLVVGVALAVVSGLAHTIGISFTADDAGVDTFGAKQAIGLAVGVAVAIVGLVIVLRERGGRRSAATSARTGEGRRG